MTDGNGKDSLSGYTGDDYISGGKGNDTLWGGDGEDTFIFQAGEGRDVIADYEQGDILQIMNKQGTDYAEIKNAEFENNTLTLNVKGGGKVQVSNVSSYTSVNVNGTTQTVSYWTTSKKLVLGTEKADSLIVSNGSKVTIDALGGNDSIFNEGGFYTSIAGGAGDDFIDNEGGFYTSIAGGAGDDFIDNEGSSVTINTGAGNDYIDNLGENVLVKVGGGDNTVLGAVTVNMGTSNNILTGDGSTQTYQYVGGDDFITNYSHEDIIHIASGKLNRYSFDGGDLILHIGNGSIRLKNMTNHAITVTDSAGKTTTKIYSNGYTPQQVLKKFIKSMMNSKSYTGRVDEAIKACSKFNSLQEVIDKMVADCQKADDADIFLRDYCGIFSNNEDNGSAIGWDAGGLSAKTISDLVPENGEASYPDSTTFTKRGVTFIVPEESTLSEEEQLVVRGFYSWWAESTLKLLEETYNVNLRGNTVSLDFFYEPDAFAWGLGGSRIQVNMAKTYITEDYNGGLDGLFAHEMTHVLQNRTDILNYMPNYMYEGMADLTGGDTKEVEITDIASDYTMLAEYLDVNNTFSEDRNVYAAGYMFWRYFMKQASDSYGSRSSYASENKSLVVDTSDDELLTVSESANAGSGNTTLKGLKAKETLDSGAGNDILRGDSGKDSLWGGDGNDAFIFRAGDGKDVIADYAAGDMLQILRKNGSDFADIKGETFQDNTLTLNVQGGGKVLVNGVSTDTAVNINDTTQTVSDWTK